MSELINRKITKRQRKKLDRKLDVGRMKREGIYNLFNIGTLIFGFVFVILGVASVLFFAPIINSSIRFAGISASIVLCFFGVTIVVLWLNSDWKELGE